MMVAVSGSTAAAQQHLGCVVKNAVRSQGDHRREGVEGEDES